MSEIININIGTAGTRIGQEFLQQIANEHFSKQQEPRGKFNVFFNEQSKKYKSRSLFLDLDSGPLKQLKLQKQFFEIPSNNIFHRSIQSRGLYSTSYYLQGKQHANNAIQKIRKQVQKCDCLSGFILINSFGGGVGSGLSCAVAKQIQQYYPSYILQGHRILPQIQNFVNPIHIYNSILSFNNVTFGLNTCIIQQNQAYAKRLISHRTSMSDINKIHAKNICQITAPFRFSGSLNTNQRKTLTNLVLYPRMIFLISSFSDKDEGKDHLLSTFNNVNFSKQNYFSGQTNYNDISAMQVNCRDNFIYQQQVDSKVRKWLSSNQLRPYQWLKHSLHQSITQPVSNLSPSSSMLINSKHIAKMFKTLRKQFNTIFQRKAFLFKYTHDGIDQMEFDNAKDQLNQIISEYLQWDQQSDYDESGQVE